MGLADFFLSKYNKLERLKNSIKKNKETLFKRKSTVFKRLLKNLNSTVLHSSYRYKDGNVKFEKILELIKDTDIDVSRLFTTDLLIDNKLYHENYLKYKNTEYIYYSPGFKNKQFIRKTFEDILWDSGLVKEIFCGQFGDFEVPDVIVEYTAKARRDGRVPDKGLPITETLLEKGKKYYEMLAKETKLNKSSSFGVSPLLVLYGLPSRPFIVP